MGAYIVRRLWQMIPTLAGVVLLIFFLFNWVGGDPALVLAGKITNPEQIENIRNWASTNPTGTSFGCSSNRS
jgi:peptide/nickel transport system permease protein